MSSQLSSCNTLNYRTDYYPGGMQMPGRSNSIGDYRYGYNGMEMDNEVCGVGNSYTTEFRQYDPRLMRWKSLDPLMSMFPWMSPYVAFDNNPIYFTDPLGLASEGEPKKGEGDEPKYSVSGERDSPRRRWKDDDGNYHKWKKGDTYTNSAGDIYEYKGDDAKGSFEDKWEVTKGDVLKFEDVIVYSNPVSDKDKPKLTMSIHAASSGFTIGGFGGEVDVVSWNYLKIIVGEGWWEDNVNLKVNEFSLLDPGAGTTVKPSAGAEILAIGGGELEIDEDYWNNNKTNSLTTLLNGKRMEIMSGSLGYKGTLITFFDNNDVVATLYIHSFALGLGGGVRQGEGNFKTEKTMTRDDSLKIAKDPKNSGRPNFMQYIKKTNR